MYGILSVVICSSLSAFIHAKSMHNVHIRYRSFTGFPNRFGLCVYKFIEGLGTSMYIEQPVGMRDSNRLKWKNALPIGSFNPTESFLTCIRLIALECRYTLNGIVFYSSSKLNHFLKYIHRIVFVFP